MSALSFDNLLIRSNRFDPELCRLADRHYSRQKAGSNQFVPPGETFVLRDANALVVIAWLYQAHRDDGQQGYNCSIFRNESPRLSSEILLEAEDAVFSAWGPNRLFTYIDARSIRSPNPGYCFKMAGWTNARDEDGKPKRSAKRNYLLLEKGATA